MPPNEQPLRIVVKQALSQWRHGAPYVVLSFHRVGERRDDDPFRYLDTISARRFRSTLIGAKSLFAIAKLDDIERPLRPGRPRLLVTFDDVSSTFRTTALPILEDLNIPVAIFPCTRIATEGSGWRDLVYYILANPHLHPRLAERVGDKLGAEAAAELARLGLYKWSKDLRFRTRWLEDEILIPIVREDGARFDDEVATRRPYLSWTDLAQLRGHRLVSIGSHGASHYDYRTLSNDEIRDDMTSAHREIERRLGAPPAAFALPFGSPDQRVWQTVDRVLPDLGLQVAMWCSPHANSGAPRGSARVTHASRINASPELRRTVRDVGRSLIRPVSNYASLFPNAKLDGQGDFVVDVERAEYMQFHALFMPQKGIHQLDGYYDYLFGANPYRGARPAHLGLRFDGNLEALVSLFWVPFAVRGERTIGPYIAGWWRLPQIHSRVGTKPFLGMAREHAAVLGGYKTSPDTRRLFERDGWGFVGSDRLEGTLRTGAAPRYEVSASYPAVLDGMLADLNRDVAVSVWRDRAYYEWRFDRYPLLTWTYLHAPDGRWVAVVGADGDTLYLSELVAAARERDASWREMLAAVADHQRATRTQRVLLETSIGSLKTACLTAGLEATKPFINTYVLTGPFEQRARGVDWQAACHETQIAGDKLPIAHSMGLD